MKTKIIYISGNEIFDAADIRAAFDEVRGTLNLSPDTVLFGVPVDADDCGIISRKSEKTNRSAAIENEIDEEKVIPILSVLNSENEEESEEEQDDEIYASEETDDSEDNENMEEEFYESDDEDIDEESEDIEDEYSDEDNDIDEEIEDSDDSEDDEFIDDNESDEDNDDEDIEYETEEFELEEIINDEIPESEEEKTLERLLEKMAPLREDSKKKEEIKTKPVKEKDPLEMLANEFVDIEDDIVTEKKSENHGKIGKLKNILPFKKAKREDSGLMGDLFGWAGIAANDDEFSMPDFFGKASKN